MRCKCSSEAIGVLCTIQDISSFIHKYTSCKQDVNFSPSSLVFSFPSSASESIHCPLTIRIPSLLRLTGCCILISSPKATHSYYPLVLSSFHRSNTTGNMITTFSTTPNRQSQCAQISGLCSWISLIDSVHSATIWSMCWHYKLNKYSSSYLHDLSWKLQLQTLTLMTIAWHFQEFGGTTIQFDGTEYLRFHVKSHLSIIVLGSHYFKSGPKGDRVTSTIAQIKLFVKSIELDSLTQPFAFSLPHRSFGILCG